MANPGIAPLFLTSALDGDEWSASRLGRYMPGETDSCTLDRGWVGLRNVLEVVEKGKIPCPCRESTPLPAVKLAENTENAASSIVAC
jgi:hypothetical protein